jgi:hypothetical protein
LNAPVGKINGRNQVRLPGFHAACGVLPDFPFLHDPPKSAVPLTSDDLSYIGQIFFPEYFIVCYLHSHISFVKLHAKYLFLELQQQVVMAIKRAAPNTGKTTPNAQVSVASHANFKLQDDDLK